MATNRKCGIGRATGPKIWVMVADAIGLVILLAAASSSVLGEWMFVLLTGVPVVASCILLKSPSRKSDSTVTPVAQPVSQRRIVISPRVAEWEPYSVA